MDSPLWPQEHRIDVNFIELLFLHQGRFGWSKEFANTRLFKLFYY